MHVSVLYISRYHTFTSFLFFFFFQAEDGIRDVAVTGVQTCALPISNELSHGFPSKTLDRRDQPRQFGTAAARGAEARMIRLSRLRHRRIAQVDQAAGNHARRSRWTSQDYSAGPT